MIERRSTVIAGLFAATLVSTLSWVDAAGPTSRHLGQVGPLAAKPAANSAPSSPRVSLAEEWALVETVVQVNAEPRDIGTLSEMLRSPAYVGSVVPGMVLSDPPSGSEFFRFLRNGRAMSQWKGGQGSLPVSGQVILLEARQVGANLFTLSTASTQLARAQNAANNLIASLETQLNQNLQRAEQQLAHADAKMSSLVERRREIRERRSLAVRELRGVDPLTWKSFLQNRLMNTLTQRFDLSTDLAVARGVLEYRRQRLRETPETVMNPGPLVRNPKHAMLESEYSELRAESQTFQNKLGRMNSQGIVRGDDTESQKLNDSLDALRRAMATAETAMRQMEPHVPGPKVKSVNPDYQREERALLEVEQSFAELSSELEALNESHARTEEIVVECEKLLLLTTEMESELNDVEREINVVSQSLMIAQSYLRTIQRSPLYVVSGPTTVRGEGR